MIKKYTLEGRAFKTWDWFKMKYFGADSEFAVETKFEPNFAIKYAYLSDKQLVQKRQTYPRLQ